MLVQGWALRMRSRKALPARTNQPVRVPHFAPSHCRGPTRHDARIGRSAPGTPSANERGSAGSSAGTTLPPATGLESANERRCEVRLPLVVRRPGLAVGDRDPAEPPTPHVGDLGDPPVMAEGSEPLDALVLPLTERVELLGGDQRVVIVVLLDERVERRSVRQLADHHEQPSAFGAGGELFVVTAQPAVLRRIGAVSAGRARMVRPGCRPNFGAESYARDATL